MDSLWTYMHKGNSYNILMTWKLKLNIPDLMVNRSFMVARWSSASAVTFDIHINLGSYKFWGSVQIFFCIYILLYVCESNFTVIDEDFCSPNSKDLNSIWATSQGTTTGQFVIEANKVLKEYHIIKSKII